MERAEAAAEVVPGQRIRNRDAALPCEICSSGSETRKTKGSLVRTACFGGKTCHQDGTRHRGSSTPCGQRCGRIGYWAADACLFCRWRSLVELADQVQNIEQAKHRLQRKLDRSRRATNPDNYSEDGTIRRGVRLTRNKSNRYRKIQSQLKYLQYCQAETRKRQHIQLANHLLSLGDTFYVEDMAWPALTHRAKETVISEKTGRIKRKKRFGKSVANKAPATLISILRQKCICLSLPVSLRCLHLSGPVSITTRPANIQRSRCPSVGTICPMGSGFKGIYILLFCCSTMIP